jgi:hypothetical protein
LLEELINVLGRCRTCATPRPAHGLESSSRDLVDVVAGERCGDPEGLKTERSEECCWMLSISCDCSLWSNMCDGNVIFVSATIRLYYEMCKLTACTCLSVGNGRYGR